MCSLQQPPLWFEWYEASCLVGSVLNPTQAKTVARLPDPVCVTLASCPSNDALLVSKRLGHSYNLLCCNSTAGGGFVPVASVVLLSRLHVHPHD